MKRFLKDKSIYIVTFIIITAIIMINYYIKGIFPFGDKSVIYSDMQDQITAFYYHFYDVFHGSKSLFIDFNTNGGIGFFGILCYYISSPITFILLLFKRENIYLAVSLVVAIKFILSGLTFLYSIRYIYKKKISYLLSICLSVLYAFSGYSLLLFLITPWMDLVYLFPLIVVGLKKVLDLEKPYLYIIFLTIGIICSFYISYMMLIFIFFISLFYILTYVKKVDRKKSITALGISTIIAIFLSIFITLPSFIQIYESSRFGYQMGSILFSKLGPITDKLEFMIISPILIATTILLLINFKNNRKFLKFYIPSLIIVCIPYIVEPINKIIHFMSYASFPNRYGFVTFYLLALGAAHYFACSSERKLKIPFKRIISVIILYFTVLFTTFILKKINLDVQKALFKLTIANEPNAFLLLIVVCLIIVISILLLSILNSKKNKFYQLIIILLTLYYTYLNVSMFIGLTSYYDVNLNSYVVQNEMYEKNNNTIFRVKNNTTSLVTNLGMVSNYYFLDHFTSLTTETNSNVQKLLGYVSYWTRISSRGGTLFTDALLANKYFLIKANYDSDMYDLVNSYSYGYNMYEFNRDISYGYMTSNVSLLDKNNTFEIQNDIYKSITNKDYDLFNIYDDFDLNNIGISSGKKYDNYHIVDTSLNNYMELNIDVKDKQVLYLNVFKQLANSDNLPLYNSMKIYINDELCTDDFPRKNLNTNLYLGQFENEVVNIKIELTKNVDLKYIGIGAMKIDDFIDFIDNYKVDSKIEFSKNKIKIHVNSDSDNIYFIPVVAVNGYKAKVNGQNSEIIKVFDNYLGVRVNEGDNEIEFTYSTPGLKLGIIISVISLISCIIIFKLGLYDKLINNDKFGSIISIIYFIIYSIAISMIFILPLITWIYAMIRL